MNRTYYPRGCFLQLQYPEVKATNEYYNPIQAGWPSLTAQVAPLVNHQTKRPAEALGSVETSIPVIVKKTVASYYYFPGYQESV